MFNPIDGALFLTGTFLFSAVGIITGNHPVLAIVAAPFITGLFMLACKVLDLLVTARRDRRLQRANEQIADLRRELAKAERGAETDATD